MLQQGTIFDSRYELVRKIGRGGFAEVWLVKDSLTGLEEALKIYAPGSGMDEDGLKIFVKELIVVHNLHHPHLLTPNMLGQYDSQPYLIMEYCPNGSLCKMVGHCTEGEAWKIIEQVASGLAYLHKRNIVHQDIKPANILVDANLDCMITDFGISLRAQSTLRNSMRIQASSGTMAYMAPERFSAEPNPIPANDIWSLGAMMFELIEGNVPFMAQLGGLAQKNGADMPIMHGDAGNELKQVIRAMLSPNAEDRPTAAELVNCAKSRTASSSSPKSAAIPKPEATPTPNPNPPSAVEEKKTQIIDVETAMPSATRLNWLKWLGVIAVAVGIVLGMTYSFDLWDGFRRGFYSLYDLWVWRDRILPVIATFIVGGYAAYKVFDKKTSFTNKKTQFKWLFIWSSIIFAVLWSFKLIVYFEFFDSLDYFLASFGYRGYEVVYIGVICLYIWHAKQITK